LPPPPLPEGLEDRLVAAIPADRRSGASRSIRWAGPLAGVAAVLAVASVLRVRLPHDRSGAPFNQTMNPDVLVHPASIASETRPCDILPPLPS
jgi:hypothetical protein